MRIRIAGGPEIDLRADPDPAPAAPGRAVEAPDRP